MTGFSIGNDMLNILIFTISGQQGIGLNIFPSAYFHQMNSECVTIKLTVFMGTEAVSLM